MYDARDVEAMQGAIEAGAKVVNPSVVPGALRETLNHTSDARFRDSFPYAKNSEYSESHGDGGQPPAADRILDNDDWTADG